MTAPAQNKRIELHSYEVTVPTADGQSVAYVVPIMVPMEWEELIQDWLLTPDAEAMIEETKARHMGLLTPAEIKELRENLNLTQAELSEMLKIGAKTWTRWETGSQRPSQSLNLLLRGLQTGVITPYSLRQLGQPQIDWTPAAVAAAETEPLSLSLALGSAEHPGVGEEMPLAA
jgi:putative zinc finger/helix-turn-helix YgiT family protein